MYSEQEIKESMDNLYAHIEALRIKYGDDFSCVISAGVKTEETWAGMVSYCGEEELLHQACHGLLKRPRFIDEFFDAVKCVLLNRADDRPEFLKEMMKHSIESLKILLIKNSDEYKEHVASKEAERIVKEFLEGEGFN